MMMIRMTILTRKTFAFVFAYDVHDHDQVDGDDNFESYGADNDKHENSEDDDSGCRRGHCFC